MSRAITTLSPDDCGFAYRDSVFKSVAPDRYVILDVTFRLKKGVAPTVRYPELAARLETAGKATPTLDDVRHTVMALRASKSMLLDASDENRRSCGSFFLNPILAADEIPRIERRLGSQAEMPRFAQPDGQVKLSAAWLIERAGYAKGQRRGAVGLSTRHALAVVCHNGAKSLDVVTFANEIRDRVRDRFGVTLSPEPTLWGFRDPMI